jgi:hypothetical protein
MQQATVETVKKYRAMAPPTMPPMSPPAANGGSVLPVFTGDEDGDADITTAAMGMLGSKLKEDSIAAVAP